MDDTYIFELQSDFDNYEYSDYFYQQLYKFYYNKGFLPIILSDITDILSILFGIIFTYSLFILIDWDNLLKCRIDNCGYINDYIITDRYPNIFQSFILFISSLWFLYKLYKFISNLNQLCKTRHFYKNTLHIDDHILYTFSWSDIIHKIQHVQPIFDVYDISSKIMRHENYMIALIDRKIIDIPQQYLTKQLYYTLKHIINTDKPDRLLLRRKCILYGLFNLLLSPFIFIIQIIHFLISNVNDLYINKNVFGPRRYNIYSKIKFRHYNEMPHYFEDRINKSMKLSNDYSRQFESPILEIIGKFVALISGFSILFFILISILDESVLLYVKFLDRSLLFYMGIFTAISSFSKTLIRAPEDRIYDPNKVMNEIVEYTHYMPSRWNGKCNTHEVKNEFLSFFPYKLALFFYDILSIFTTPFFLFTLPSRNIVEFIKLNTVYNDSVGNICSITENNNDTKMKQSLVFFNKNIT